MAFFGITNLGYQNPIGDQMITPRGAPYPNQLYRVPLTDNQRYGWSVTKTEGPEPWTQMKRFPRQNSEMTNFVKAMMLTDPDFSLF
uniref:Uncharacterized protein n=1 Tax=Gadus morhua TaxID=8049 RepID=A0A8C5A783_GADMO